VGTGAATGGRQPSIFLAWEGFELIANTATEIERPEKNLPQV
jgi:L-asparagine transporter-like permease